MPTSSTPFEATTAVTPARASAASSTTAPSSTEGTSQTIPASAWSGSMPNASSLAVAATS